MGYINKNSPEGIAKLKLNRMFDISLELAARHHREIHDKGGYPYIMHALRIAMQLDDIEEQCAAVLHDTKEDDDIHGSVLSDNVLHHSGLSERIIILRQGMTRGPNESWTHYINRIDNHPDDGVRRIKVLDLKDNINLCRIPSIKDNDLQRCKRYREALEKLGYKY